MTRPRPAARAAGFREDEVLETREELRLGGGSGRRDLSGCRDGREGRGGRFRGDGGILSRGVGWGSVGAGID